MAVIRGRARDVLTRWEEGLRRTIAWYLAHPDWLERVRSGAYREYLRQQYGGAVV